jgi:hypothetical protein
MGRYCIVGSVVNISESQNKVGKNDIMLVCEEYYKGFYKDIPIAQDYEDKEFQKILESGSVLSVRYEEYNLVPFLISGMLKMRMCEDVLYFEISTGVGKQGAFNKITPIHRKGKEVEIKHNVVRFLSDKIMAVCLKTAYESNELIPADE